MERGAVDPVRTRSSAAPTVRPDMLAATSSTGLWRLPLIDHSQNPKRSAIGQCVMHEVHAPALAGPGRHRRRAAVQGHVLASADPHAHLEPVEVIEPAHALTVDRPALAAQHPDPEIAEARPRVGEVPDPQPQCGLIARLTWPIPGRPTELGQPTDPPAAGPKGALKPRRQLLATSEPQAFFRSASASMCLSSVRSATRRFWRRFSSSSRRIRRTSVAPRCLYFFFHA